MENRRCSPAVLCGVLTGGVSIYGEQALLSSCDVQGSLKHSLEGAQALGLAPMGSVVAAPGL